MKKKILVRVDGSKEIGLGHVFNMLTILAYFKNSEILILMDKNKKLGMNKLKKSNYNVKSFSSQSDLIKIIEKFKPNIIFNDILNTESNYMKKLQRFHALIVNFEDIGQGKKLADLVFNPIYYSKNKKKNEFYGEEYACVREEFKKHSKNFVRKKVKKVVITFGGTDPTNKTSQILKILYKLNLSDIEFNIILGPGFSKRELIRKISIPMKVDGFKINIIEKVDSISQYVKDCDFAITSNGRTTFEIASMRVPMISIAVNQREKNHSFVKHSKSGLHVDMSSNLDNRMVLVCINQMLDQKNRKKFVDNMRKINILNGVKRVVKIINKEFDMHQKLIPNSSYT